MSTMIKKDGDTLEALKQLFQGKDDVLDGLAMLGRNYTTNSRDTTLAAVINKLAEHNRMAFVLDSVLTVCERHNIKISDEIVVKTLECASYAEWQKIKAEAWGKN